MTKPVRVFVRQNNSYGEKKMTEEIRNPLREGLHYRRTPEAALLVIWGATGDLTKRKLIPALFNLYRQNLLPPDFRIVAFGRRRKDEQAFREELSEALKELGEEEPQQQAFLSKISYHSTDFEQAESQADAVRFLEKLEQENGLPGNRLFYLSTPPSAYETIISGIKQSGLNKSRGWTRIIIEKPFGRDLQSARQLNRIVSRVFHEDQIYRIDHYLGKETVQNILVFRFANGIFEPIWNRRYIDHVQITVAETLGVEGRGAFFEETGILRDIVQNHVLQLLCLFAMEPPSSLDAGAVRDEKVKVLRAIKELEAAQVDEATVRAQYVAGSLMGQRLPGYREEEGVSPNSTTETYAALRLWVDNWRWAGVPFYLRAGKRMPKRISEIAVYFKNPPLPMFSKSTREQVGANVLALRIQPDEGISLRFASKVPGHSSLIRPVTMDFRYGTSFGTRTPDAYERLLLDALLGDATLFTRSDENLTAWEILEPILSRWQSLRPETLPVYPIGSWGPPEADLLINRDGRQWRRL